MAGLSQTGWLVVVTVVPAMLISGISLYPVRRFANRLGLVDQPGGHSTHTRVTPLGGGIGIYLGVLGTLVLGGMVVATLPATDGQLLGLQFPPTLQSLRPGILAASGSAAGLILGGSILALLGFL